MQITRDNASSVQKMITQMFGGKNGAPGHDRAVHFYSICNDEFKRLQNEYGERAVAHINEADT